MPTKSKSSKKGGATFGYVEQFNYPLSPCYNEQKNQVKAGWHSGGNGSCSSKQVEDKTTDFEMNGGKGFFDWLLGNGDKKKSTSSTSSKKKKSTSSTSSKKKKSTSTGSSSGKKKQS